MAKYIFLYFKLLLAYTKVKYKQNVSSDENIYIYVFTLIIK